MAYMRYYRSLLNEREKDAYDALVEGIAKRRETITFPIITDEELERVHISVDHDYPDFFYVDFYQPYYVFYPTHIEATVSYVMDYDTARRLKKEIDEKAAKIVEGAKGMTEYQTVGYLNDEIRKLAVYKNKDDDFNVQHLVGTFIDGECVCEGYAKSFKYLADMLQLKSIIVLGYSGVRGDVERHAWNIVRIGGENYHVDVTFNDFERDEESGEIVYFSRAYFNLSDKEILRDHTIDPMFKVPSCPKSRNEVPIISSTSSLVNYLRLESQKNKKISEARLTKYFDPNDLRDTVYKVITPDDFEWFYRMQIVVGAYSLIIKWDN